jgi:F0F1-type ATP synthase membrane subunit b/b'
MNIEEILNKMEALKNSGSKLPGFRGKIMVDAEMLAQVYDQIKSGLPANFEEAQTIIMQRDSIVTQARLEAERIREQSENSAKNMGVASSVAYEEKISQNSVTQEAVNRGEELTKSAAEESQSIIQDAQRKAYTIVNEMETKAVDQKKGADRYSMEVLSALEETLAASLGQIRRGIDNLRLDGSNP